jgi:hypothetical protein
MAFNFLDHEFNVDQRSSTPKSSRSSTRHLFHSNESAILEIESSTSVVDRSKLKRRREYIFLVEFLSFLFS